MRQGHGRRMTSPWIRVNGNRADASAMKLDTLEPDRQDHERQRQELAVLLAQPSYRELRPCKGCAMPCPCSGSKTCACLCGPGCPQMPSQMSSEGEHYPVEPKIAPLVFAFFALRLCPPVLVLRRAPRSRWSRSEAPPTLVLQPLARVSTRDRRLAGPNLLSQTDHESLACLSLLLRERARYGIQP